jgi:tellurite resistance protein TerC
MIPDSWLWVGFGLFVATMLALDLGVFHRRTHEVRLREALIWTGVWVGLALLFWGGVWHWLGAERGLEFLTGYVIELSLSVDNLFVFLLIFGYFRVPPQYQHKVLFWGIIGALAMRLVFIAAGIALLEKFHWVIYGFGAILIISGIKMAVEKDREVHPEKNPVLRWFRAVMPVTSEYHGGSFVIRSNGRRVATPLLVVLIAVESADLVFAVDSVPAVLAITTDPFIVYTSNVFAILGLRSMFFALAGIMGLFCYLHYGLSAVLVFVGAKMVLSDVVEIPTVLSLGIVTAILAVSMAASIARRRRGPAPETACEVGESAAAELTPESAGAGAGTSWTRKTRPSVANTPPTLP